MLGNEELEYVGVDEVFDEVVSLFPNLKNIKILNCTSGLGCFSGFPATGTLLQSCG